MSWPAYLKWRREAQEIADASAYGTTVLMERASDASDVFEFVALSAPMVLSSYAQSAQDSALGYLRTAHRDAGLGTLAYAPQTAVLTRTAVEPVIKWAFSDLVAPFTVEKVLPRLVQGSTRLVLNEGRHVVTNGLGEIEGGAYRRVPRGNACAYCRMMSQWTYATREEAEFTKSVREHRKTGRKGRVYRYTNGGLPMAARGSKQAAGSRFHSKCRCEPVAYRLGDTLTDVPQEIEERWETFTDQWEQARPKAWAERQKELDKLYERSKTIQGGPDAQKRWYRSQKRKLPNYEQYTLRIMRETHKIR